MPLDLVQNHSRKDLTNAPQEHELTRTCNIKKEKERRNVSMHAERIRGGKEDSVGESIYRTRGLMSGSQVHHLVVCSDLVCSSPRNLKSSLNVWNLE
eukprot:1888626-Rhodomonas_salina.2